MQRRIRTCNMNREICVRWEVVYQARPLLSLAGSWGRGVGKAREGLADVISVHELLANQILLPSFGGNSDT